MNTYKVDLATSPYRKINFSRLKNPKFIYRITKQWIDKIRLKKKNLTVYDLGCANGELLHYLNHFYKNFQFTGIELNSNFVNVAKNLLKNKKNIVIKKKNIFNLTKKKRCYNMFRYINYLSRTYYFNQKDS